MRKQLLFFSLLLLSCMQALCQASDSCKIVFYRENAFQASAVSFKIYQDDSLIVKLKNNSYYTHTCLPGEYDFRVNKSDKTSLHLKADSGQTYYLRVGIRSGMWSSTTEILRVDEISALPVVDSGVLRELDGKNTPMVRSKNRFGVNLNIGFGFENTSMAMTTNGEESTISFGGGCAVGLKYGREFTRHFDLAVDLNYQFSMLRPNLKNADVTFGRGNISVTPSYIFPIDGGDNMRIKAGAGIDNYFGSNLSIDMSKLSGGIKDDWKYKNAFGYHVSGIFEMSGGGNWSMSYGLKWYNASYSFKSGNRYQPSDHNLQKPNGSGIDILMGIYYHF